MATVTGGSIIMSVAMDMAAYSGSKVESLLTLHYLPDEVLDAIEAVGFDVNEMRQTGE
jgi:hypothetical protein